MDRIARALEHERRVTPDDRETHFVEIPSAWLAIDDDDDDSNADEVTKRLPSTMPPRRPTTEPAPVFRLPQLKPLPLPSPPPERPWQPEQPKPVVRRSLPPIRPLPPRPAPPAGYDQCARNSTKRIWHQPLFKSAVAYGALVGAVVFGGWVAVLLAMPAAASSEARDPALLVTVASPAGAVVSNVTVTADGVAHCNGTPCIIHLGEGTHFISASAPGFTPTAARAIQIQKGRDTAIDIALWPRTEQPTPAKPAVRF